MRRVLVAQSTPLAALTSLVLSALGVLACSGDSPTPKMDVTPAYDADTLKMKGDLVMALIRDLTCNDDSQCSSFAYGVKACGGPAMYVVYSTLFVDPKALSDAVADFNAYDAGWILQEKILSDCMLAPTASPACVQNSCVDLNKVH
jgi:hypothetical protein